MSFYLQEFKDLIVTQENFQLMITLNRPQASNAFSDDMIASLVRVLRHADQDQNIRVILVTGAGKNFCAGGDIKAMENKTGMFQGEPNELRERYRNGIQEIPRTMIALTTPVIAMINGAAIGAGLDFACMCDMRVASYEASFGETFAKLGLVSGDGGNYFLSRIVGFAKATEMAMTCNIYSAEDAKHMGLINSLVSPERLTAISSALATKIAAHPPMAIQMTKRALLQAYHSDIHTHLDLMAAFQGITQRSSDHFTSLQAFKEKSDKNYLHK
jgi:enoyl-CoA hydratase/carnithine racemase